ncbi:methyl-accepting chemotaxis protein [Skermanella stibiiresistens SB22]|uniref:Methyl-accepting chemotaxis protein n=1 Tax=Skermanella stibiiresistens SB22 TaxID=1385369 RepID=W9H6Y2_9PROT|nr:methyl-accepting chemotaxis protein [Skermanella stibiiresistens]EWY41995.1 methyl-accepting chemotaxis protein [Skermanella stibiiresistens SB22]
MAKRPTLSNLPFFFKFALAPGLSVCLMIVVATVGYTGLGRLVGDLRMMVEANLRGGIDLATVSGRIDRVNGQLYQTVVAKAAQGTEARLEERLTLIRTELDAIIADLGTWRDRYAQPHEQGRLTEAIEGLATYREMIDVVESMLEFDFRGVVKLIGPLEENYKKLNALIATVIASGVDNARVQADQSATTADLMRLVFLGSTLFAVVAVAGFSWGIGRATTGSIERIAAATRKLADGRRDVDIGSLARDDELGAIVESLAVFRDNGVKLDQSWEAQRLGHEQRERRAQAMEELVLSLDGEISRTLNQVTSATETLEAAAGSLSTVAQQTEHQADSVTGAASLASSNVDAVASTAERLSLAITEIERQVGESTRVAGQAVTSAERANDLVTGMDETTRKIGEVVKLITSIAAKTNLLALNATIEAARAGEAGKGFAVVANEVKALANQTAHATGEITAQINAVQDATRLGTEAIRDITRIIGRMNEIGGIIAGAVRDQSGATHDIVESARQAADGTRTVSRSIEGVRDGAGETGKAADDVNGAVTTLSRQASDLRGMIDRFLTDIRSVNTSGNAA